MACDIAAIKRKYCIAHPDRVKESRKKWLTAHPDYHKKYNVMHQEQYCAYRKKWCLAHPEKARAISGKWGKEHPEQKKANDKNFRQTTKGRVCKRRRRAARKRFGFIPLNKYFKGAAGHHININYVIYVPKELHTGIRHSVARNQNMKKINAMAFKFLKETVNQPVVFEPCL